MIVTGETLYLKFEDSRQPGVGILLATLVLYLLRGDESDLKE